jgi:hypothetical protein
LTALVVLAAMAYLGKLAYMLVRYKAYIWFPSYVDSMFKPEERVPDQQKHLLFLMVDHYEPGTAIVGSRSFDPLPIVIVTRRGGVSSTPGSTRSTSTRNLS